MANILIKREDIILKANSLPIEIMVYSDRAQVTRRQEVELKKGENTIEFTNLGVGIEEQTIKVNVASKSVRVNSATLEQNYLYFFKEALHEKKYNELITVLKKVITLIDNKTAYALENYLISDLRNYMRIALNDIMLEQDVSITRLREALEYLENLLNENVNQVLSINKSYSELIEKLSFLRQEINEIRELDKKIQNNIILTLVSNNALKIKAEISYIVPNVSWKTSYDALLNVESGDVELGYYGEIMQKTGEDWQNVRVMLSTSVVEGSVEIPKIYPVYLSGFVQKREKTLVVTETATKELKNEEEADEEGEAPEIEQRVEVSQKGAAHTFTIEMPCDIPPDGRYHRSLILRKSFRAETYYETVPELMEFIYLKTAIKNNTDLPLLPGKVMVYRNSSYMGNTKLAYIATGEELAISFGIDDDLRIKRIVLISSFKKAKGLSLKNKREYKYQYKLYNYKTKTEKVILKERVHVSEIGNVRVAIKENTTKGYKKDKEGIVSWEIEVPPHKFDYKEVILHYTLTAPKSFNLGGII